MRDGRFRSRRTPSSARFSRQCHPRSRYVLAVDRKYDDCHGGPSPTPQELTRARGHRRLAPSEANFFSTGDPGLSRNSLLDLSRVEISLHSLAFVRINASTRSFRLVRAARAAIDRARVRSFPLAGKPPDYECVIREQKKTYIYSLFYDTYIIYIAYTRGHVFP